MFCAHCGKEIVEGARFCAHCGASSPVPPAAPAPVKPVAEAPATAVAVMEAPVPVEEVAVPVAEAAPVPVEEAPAPQTITCTNCGNTLPAGAKFCNACGKDPTATVVAAAPVEDPPAPQTITCTNCGNTLPAGAKFCSACGKDPTATVVAAAPIEESPAPQTITCTNCGNTLPAGAKFCSACGKNPTAPVVVATPVATPAATPAPAKKSKKGPVIAIIAAVLVVALAVGGFFGYRYFADLQTYEKASALMEEGDYEEALKLFKGISVKDSADKAKDLQELLGVVPTNPGETDPDADPTTTPTVEPTVEPTVAPSAPTVTPSTPTEPVVEDIKLTVKQAELVYELSEADIEEYYRLLQESEAIALTETNWDVVDDITNQLSDQYDYLSSQYTIAMVLYYCNLNDTAASDLYLECTDTVTQAHNDYIEMLRRVYNSDAPCKEQLFEDWTERDIQMLMAYSEEIMHLEQRNSELEVAYQDIQNTPYFQEQMVPIYVEMVCNNNRIAQIYGYENYYVYAYEQVYDRDYAPEQIHQMRSLAEEYLNDALYGALNSFYSKYGSMDESNSTRLVNFLYESYNKSQIEGYLNTLPEQMRQNMASMFNGNIIMKDSSRNAMEGAFTTNITEDRSICFFGPGYSNPMTVVHEVGHYYGSCHTNLDDIPLDLAETQSQGNEWLFLRHLESNMNSTLYNTLVDYKLYSDISTVIICLAVDEFEERVYSHSDPASLTGEDLDAIMAEVCEAYGGISYLETVATDMQYYWRMVVVEQPVYYISYGVSAIASMDLYNISAEDYDNAVELYRRLNEELDVDKGFLGNLSDAGIATPFEEDVYKFLAERFAG